MKRKAWKGLLWTAVFVGIFLLSQDYLFFDWAQATLWLGFPLWLYWFVFVQIAWAAAIWLFARNFWED